MQAEKHLFKTYRFNHRITSAYPEYKAQMQLVVRDSFQLYQQCLATQKTHHPIFKSITHKANSIYSLRKARALYPSTSHFESQ